MTYLILLTYFNHNLLCYLSSISIGVGKKYNYLDLIYFCCDPIHFI